MRKQYFFLLMLALILFPLVSATTYPTDTNISFKIPTNLTSCNLTITGEDTTSIIDGQLMSSGQGFASYNILSGNFSVGEYDYFSECGSGSFTVTQSGQLATGNMEIFIWILFIIAFVGNILLLILILVKLATTSETIFGVLTAWGFYMLLIMVSFLAGYLTNNFIISATDLLMTILVWSNGVLPLISLIITMFVKGTKKKKPIGIQEFTGRVPFGRGGY